FTDFPQAESTSHSFINGPRGSGKSMMFRMMRPDCLCLRRKCEFKDLPYLGLYVPIKSTKIGLTELLRLDAHPAKYVFNEHLLCLYVAIRAFDELASVHCDYTGATYSENEASKWANDVFIQRLKNCGGKLLLKSDLAKGGTEGPRLFFAGLRDLLEEL